MRLVKKVPVPIAGLMLALVATGNLVGNYGNQYRNFFGILGAMVFLLLTTKFLTNWRTVKEEFSNPLIASVAPTYSMGLMILATYIKPVLPTFAYGVWLSGLVIHVLLMIYFTRAYIINFSIKNVFPSYFIVFVGIVAGSVTAPVFDSLLIGKILFWFGLVAYLLLLPIVSYRMFKVKNLPEPAQPTITIFAAPASLCLAGYMSSFPEKSLFMVGFLTGISVVMTLAVLVDLPKLLKLQFYPSYSAFTFPFVISAIALKKTIGFLASIDQNIVLLKPLGLIEEWIAVLMVLYVLLRYVNFLFADFIFSSKAKSV